MEVADENGHASEDDATRARHDAAVTKFHDVLSSAPGGKTAFKDGIPLDPYEQVITR